VGPNGYQLFVRSDDHGAVEKAIRDHVREAGCGAVVDPDSDEIEEAFAERRERRFALSTVRDGTMAVWEDGGWADRLLARALSKSLRTRTTWLMVSDSTDSWAYAIYESGDLLEHGHHEPDDPIGEAERFAREHALPFALQYLDEPDDEDDPEVLEDMRRRGVFDPPAHVEDIQRLLRDAPVEVVTFDDDEEDDDLVDADPADDVEVMRGEFIEFTVECPRS
jgi:hypothetical protein